MEGKNLGSLDCFFYPKSVALIGASKDPKKSGHAWLNSLLQYGFQGKIYPINPSEDEVLGLKAYKTIMDVPGEVDLALFTIPAPGVLKVMEECGEKGVRAGIIHSTGFAESGEEGVLLQRKVVEIARNKNVRLIGPNCVGTLCPESRLPWARRSTFPEEVGRVGIISQSGGGAGSFVSIAQSRGINFSKVISIGNECDVSVADFMEYFQEDPKTDVVFIYLEGIKDGKRFMEVAKPLCRNKPVIIYKIGRTEVGKKATASHTGSIAGSLEIYDGALRQVGALRVGDTDEVLNALVGFSNVWFNQGIPRGPRVGILSGPGGPGVATADACMEAGLQVPEFSDETKRKFAEEIPLASPNNPSDADFGFTLKGKDPFVVRTAIIENDQNIDMIALVGFGEFRAKATTESILGIQETCKKPFIVIWPSAGKDVEECKEILQKKKVPLFFTPERGAKSLGILMKYKKMVERLKKEDVA